MAGIFLKNGSGIEKYMQIISKEFVAVFLVVMGLTLLIIMHT
jgi:hypothetical protein